ncbi:hypothetical protein CVT26_008475 [Gymnopilus dilepis]|uniref:Aquaporin n=1 Tax=Gymnopilus dilepis TaxID=231916 RepID=A0A409XXJ3_9AGAR|nr:hypothetical protein CVT26_008475 [Gymnopilus dilepis]
MARSPSRYSTLFSNLGDDCAAAVFEFVGTVCFLLFGLGGIQAATAESTGSEQHASTVAQVLYISTSMGLSLLISAWLFYRATGGLFNPNVTLSLLIVGSLGPVRFVLYCIAQLVGAIAAAAILRGLTSAPLSVNTVLQGGTNRAQGVFIEMFITAALVIAVLMLAAEKHQATPFAPVGIGLTLFVCELFAVYYTGGAMNTARSFGPAVVTGFPDPNHWVYWVGPFLGSLLGTTIYTLLKHYRYWTLVPDQATSDPKKSPDDPLLTVKNTLTSNRDADDAAFAEPTGGAESSQNVIEVGQNHASASSNGQESRRLNDSAV